MTPENARLLVSLTAIFTAVLAGYVSIPPDEHVLAAGDYELQGSFIGGGPYPLTRPPDSTARPVRLFGSWINDQQHVGTLKSPPFRLPHDGRLSLRLSGYPNKEGNVIALQRIDSGESHRFIVQREPREDWVTFTFQAPSTWRNIQVRLIASANSTGFGNWIGLSEPLTGRSHTRSAQLLFATLSLYGGMLVQFGALALIGFACALLAGYRAHPLVSGIVGTALVAYAGFWIYLVNVHAGTAYSMLALAVAIAVVVRVGRRDMAAVTDVARSVRFPVAVWLLYSILAVSLGFLYGYDDPMSTAAHRYFHWTADNELPHVYALKILNIPQSQLWDDSNVYARPPLQTAFVLLVAPLTTGYLSYQTLGTLLQSTVLLGVWALLEAFAIPAPVRRRAFLMVVFSVFVLINSVFVWPKLLSAAFLFLAFATWVRTDGERRLDLAIIGACFALAMLSHGGAFFPIAAAILFACFRVLRLRRFRALAHEAAVIGAAGALLLGSWMLYAGMQGKPTDELVKWHLGGSLPNEATRAKSTLRTIYDGYAALSPGDILANKIENLRMQLFPAGPSLLTQLQTAPATPMKIFVDATGTSTLYVLLVPLLMLPVALALALPSMATAFTARPVILCITFGLTATVVWCVLMFGPRMAYPGPGSAAATLFQSSFFPPLCLLVGLSVALSLTSTLVSNLMLAVQIIVFTLIGFSEAVRTDGPGILRECGTLDPVLLTASLAALIAIALQPLAEPLSFPLPLPQQRSRRESVAQAVR